MFQQDVGKGVRGQEETSLKQHTTSMTLERGRQLKAAVTPRSAVRACVSVNPNGQVLGRSQKIQRRGER